jgi:hypothetical protein
LLRRLLAWRRALVSPRHDAGDPSMILFAVTVIGWWMALAGVVTLLVPAPAASATRTAHRPMPGSRAHVALPGMQALPVPVSRLAFDTAQRGFAESDEDAIELAFAMSEWIAVSDRDAVRIVAVDGEAVEIELLDGPWAGRRAWVKPRLVGP